jgi:transcriptional regulator with XRE-family HTH domain
MHVRDLRKLKRLLVIHDVSARQLAVGAGYASHTSVNRLLAGTATSVPDDKAKAIARYLHVEVDDLFVPETSSVTRRSAKAQRAS